MIEAAPPSIAGGFKGEKWRENNTEREKARQTKSVGMEKRKEEKRHGQVGQVRFISQMADVAVNSSTVEIKLL